MPHAKKRTVKNDVIAKAFDDVPEVGARWNRWYDIPYKIAWWQMRGWRKKVFPRTFRDASIKLVNILLQFNEYDRQKAWDKKDKHNNINIPKDESVSIPSIFIVELFTANEAKILEKSIRKNGWDKYKRALHKKDTNLDRLAKARTEQGASWWRLADVRKKDSKWFMPDAKVGRLPEGFESASLRAVQIGSGLTAVVARFSLSNSYNKHVDDVWRSQHEPKIQYISGSFRVLNRLFSAYETTQKTREQLHNQARDWMSEFCPGFFSMHKEQHVSLDIILTEQLDPTSRSKKFSEHEAADAYRALGVDISSFRRITSKHLPGLLLQQADRLSEPNINTRRTWSLIGKRSKLATLTDNFKYYSDEESGVSNMSEDSMGYTLTLLGVQEMLASIEKRFSSLRDQANQNHKKFKVRNLRKLNRIIMDSSFTLTSIKQDITTYLYEERWYDGAELIVTISPPFKDRLKDTYKESESFHKLVIKQLNDRHNRLLALDKDIRDILSTVANLGSSASSIVLGRWALGVSALSLLAAVAALVVSMHLHK